ncbi:ubiquitin carboxyl-terminal hydrolase 5 [Tanacetum coccineum]
MSGLLAHVTTRGTEEKSKKKRLEDVPIVRDFPENKKEHEEHLKAILELLKKEELYAKFSKCEFWIPKVQFLVHVIDSEGIHVDPAKIESIKDWASPKSPTEILYAKFSKNVNFWIPKSIIPRHRDRSEGNFMWIQPRLNPLKDWTSPSPQRSFIVQSLITEGSEEFIEFAIASKDGFGRCFDAERRRVSYAFTLASATLMPAIMIQKSVSMRELHAFLLDEIYEDMNRDKNKPYIKSKVADGRPDEEVADKYWANHIARNNLIIMDMFLGQYKSTLFSPACEKISVTFDPFMHLSLPLQSTTTRKMSLTVFSCDRSVVHVTCTVTVLKQGRVRDFIQAFSSACALKQNETVFIVEIRNHLIQHLLEDPLMSLSSIKDDDHLRDQTKVTIVLWSFDAESSKGAGHRREISLMDEDFFDYTNREVSNVGHKEYDNKMQKEIPSVKGKEDG